MDQKLIYEIDGRQSNPSQVIDPSSIGSIWDDDGFIASGFVLVDERLIVSSAHILNNTREPYYYVTASDNQGHDIKHNPLSIFKIIKEYDLLVLESGDSVCKRPFPMASKLSPTLGDRIFYYGYDQKIELHQKYNKNRVGVSIEPPQGRYLRESKIDRLGTVTLDNGHHIAHYFEYYGYSVPGYSGGVITNEVGEALAINTLAWVTHGFRDKETDLSKNINSLVLNQAFLIQHFDDSINEWRSKTLI